MVNVYFPLSAIILSTAQVDPSYPSSCTLNHWRPEVLAVDALETLALSNGPISGAEFVEIEKAGAYRYVIMGPL